jgi:DNA-directed RNA polymerase specialized sigma24 family protein
MNTDTFSIDDIDWEEIILRLTAFTCSWTNGRAWFRGGGTSDFLAGKKVEDYVYEAITRFLEAPEKYNSAKGDLLKYLKYQIVRTLVGNDLRKLENKKTDDIFAYDDTSCEEEDNIPYSERVMPFTVALFPDDIDYQAIKVYIETEIQGDKDAENVFLGVYISGMKRREVMEELDMSASAFDNGMRRLNTVLRRAALHFSEKRPTI